MHKKSIAIIIAVISVTYAGSLLNGFVRDDHLFFENNSFYRSLENFPVLFQKQYIVTGSRIALSPPGDLGSGEVSYRPVGSATFFIDGRLWPDSPLGYHLQNFLLHLANSILVYFFVWAVTAMPLTALLAALLFGVHPIHSEAVCNIGFRADLLAFFFSAMSFLLFIGHDRVAGFRRAALYGGALLSFFLAVFSKESAVFLPLMLVAYDCYFPLFKREERFFLRLFRRHAAFVAIVLFFFYIYFSIFPNSTLDASALIGGGLKGHLVAMLRIFGEYIAAFFAPWSINVLPTLYAPSIASFPGLVDVLFLLVLIVFPVLIIKTRQREKSVSFFLLWFLAMYIPVSNIVPIANPMAYRFMYLPSLGILCVFAVLLRRLDRLSLKARRLPTIGKIGQISVLALCMLLTLNLNNLWKNDAVLALDITRHYPEDPSGHFALGVEFFKLGLYGEAAASLRQAQELGSDDPRVFYFLGLCFHDDLNKMKEYFRKALEMRPDFALVYFALGHQYMAREDYPAALPYLQKGIELAPEFSAPYEDLATTYIRLGRLRDARAVARRAQALFGEGMLEDLSDLIGGQEVLQ